MLTQEGRLLQTVQKGGGLPDDDEMDTYAIQLAEFLDRKESLIMALQSRLDEFHVQLSCEQQLAQRVTHLTQYWSMCWVNLVGPNRTVRIRKLFFGISSRTSPFPCSLPLSQVIPEIRPILGTFFDKRSWWLGSPILLQGVLVEDAGPNQKSAAFWHDSNTKLVKIGNASRNNIVKLFEDRKKSRTWLFSIVWNPTL